MQISDSMAVRSDATAFEDACTRQALDQYEHLVASSSGPALPPLHSPGARARQRQVWGRNSSPAKRISYGFNWYIPPESWMRNVLDRKEVPMPQHSHLGPGLAPLPRHDRLPQLHGGRTPGKNDAKPAQGAGRSPAAATPAAAAAVGTPAAAAVAAVASGSGSDSEDVGLLGGPSTRDLKRRVFEWGFDPSAKADEM